MTLRALVSFDHIALNTNYSLTVGGTYAPNSLQSVFGVPGAMMTGNSSNGAAVQPNGWLGLTASNATLYAGYVVSLADAGILQNGITQAWIGFRTYATAVAPSGASTVGVLPGSAAGALGGGGANVVSMLTETQLNRQAGGVAGAQYVECFLDISANTYTTYVNGAQVASGSLPAAITHIVFSGQPFSGTSAQAYRDFYFLDVDATKPNGRLGPITSTPLLATNAGVQAPTYGNYTPSLNSSSAISTTQAKFGPASYSWNSSAAGAVVIPDSASVRTIALGDVTYECWAMSTNASQSVGFLSKDSGAAPWARLQLSNGVWQLLTDQASGTPALSVTGNPPVNQWFHLALVRYNGTWTIYQNGVSLGSVAGNGTFGNNTYNLILGNTNNLGSAFQGYIDEFRMSNIARYTANFTPPAQQFATDANTMVLLHLDSVYSSLYVADHSGNQPLAISAAYGATPTMAPVMQNGADNGVMSVNFIPTALPGQKVVAMQYKLAAQVPFAINLLASLQAGGTTKTLSPYLFRDTVANYARDLAGIQTSAPDGTAWSAANISATNLLLQPQSTTAGSIN